MDPERLFWSAYIAMVKIITYNNSVAKNVNLTGKIAICNHNQREVKIIIFCHKIGFHNYACLSLQKSIQNELWLCICSERARF